MTSLCSLRQEKNLACPASWNPDRLYHVGETAGSVPQIGGGGAAMVYILPRGVGAELWGAKENQQDVPEALCKFFFLSLFRLFFLFISFNFKG